MKPKRKWRALLLFSLLLTLFCRFYTGLVGVWYGDIGGLHYFRFYSENGAAYTHKSKATILQSIVAPCL